MMSDFLGSFLTPLALLIRFLPSTIQFFGVILDLPSPPKIGHHLCTHPYLIRLESYQNTVLTNKSYPPNILLILVDGIKMFQTESTDKN